MRGRKLKKDYPTYEYINKFSVRLSPHKASTMMRMLRGRYKGIGKNLTPYEIYRVSTYANPVG